MDVIFHIGKIKTGTTSIQNFLATNTSILKKYGIYYGEYVVDWGGVPPAHFNFFYATVKEALTNLGYKSLAFSLYPTLKSFEMLLNNTIQEASQMNCGKIIISCENYSQILSFITTIFKENNILIDSKIICECLRDVFKHAIDKYSINLSFIIYLREQSDLFLSAYNQAVKGGHFFGKLDTFCMNQLGNTDNDDFNTLLFLESIVPKEKIAVRIFEKTALKGGLIQDFLSLIIDEFNISEFAVKKEANVSLSYEIIEFRRFLGSNLPKKNKQGLFYEFIFEDFQKQLNKYNSKISFPPDLKIKIQSYYLEMNKSIAERYFHSNPPELFSESLNTNKGSIKAHTPLDIQTISNLTCAFISFIDKINNLSDEANKKMAKASPLVQDTRATATPKFSQNDLENGAPYGPLPRSFYLVDPRLDICQPLIQEAERTAALKLRSEFRRKEQNNVPFFDDKARAFRLLKGKSTYLEVGTFDRGNLAYVSTFLAENAILIGVDVAADDAGDALLREKLRPRQTYISITGNSRSPATLAAIREVLGDRMLDAVFIDANHTAYSVMSDYANCEPLVADTGVFLFHDSVWEGNEKYKGVADALDEISKIEPVYLIDGRNPCKIFTRPLWRAEFWGCIGVIFASDQKWRTASS